MDIIERAHQKGTTVIMVCHDMEVVADYATRCIVMSDGRVVDDAPTFEVLRNRDTLERASLVPPQIVDLSLELGRAIPRLRTRPWAAPTRSTRCWPPWSKRPEGPRIKERSVSA